MTMQPSLCLYQNVCFLFEEVFQIMQFYWSIAHLDTKKKNYRR
jgi:hypothetical protein